MSIKTQYRRACDAGLRRGDIVVELDGQPVVTTTVVQKLMVEITVRRNGALVDVFAIPSELQESRPGR